MTDFSDTLFPGHLNESSSDRIVYVRPASAMENKSMVDMELWQIFAAHL
ncbi:hypothetical protein V202x_16010 [Gimesia aquarii]|uniref:Uncharacterized protein n=1 Tax=Gimesia aquarii TaxID=2527964 RepID=A0A517WSJ9_9PLAN|nr:hypothetical protein V202x_16010 [Gimesia aquarii]